jgi:hypothetical protein
MRVPVVLTPSEIGAVAEREVAVALVAAGWNVFVPLFAAHSRVDLVVENESGVHRVQCKTSRLVDGAIAFRTCSNTANRPKDYRGQVDYFGVWSPELRQAFLIPVDAAPSRLCHLRVSPARSGQLRGTRPASEYLVGPTQSGYG